MRNFNNKIHIAGITLLALFWGGSFLGIHFAIASFPPFTSATIRVAIGGLLTFLLLRFKRERFPRDPSLFWQLVATGFFTLGLPWAMLFWGEQFVSPAMCSILNSSTPLFTVLIAALFLSDERITWNKWLGVLVGFAGVVVIFGPEIAEGGDSQLGGLIALVGMAICYAIGIVWLKGLLLRVGSGVAFFLQCVGALALLIPLSIFAEGHTYAQTDWSILSAWMGILYLAVFSTALAQVIFIALIRNMGPVKASAVTYLIPLVAIALDWVVFGTLVSIYALIGGAVILTGVRLIHSPDVLPLRRIISSKSSG